jgi:hypothetical protein
VIECTREGHHNENVATQEYCPHGAFFFSHHITGTLSSGTRRQPGIVFEHHRCRPTSRERGEDERREKGKLTLG